MEKLHKWTYSMNVEYLRYIILRYEERRWRYKGDVKPFWGHFRHINMVLCRPSHPNLTESNTFGEASDEKIIVNNEVNIIS